jgi:hypothetical protein
MPGRSVGKLARPDAVVVLATFPRPRQLGIDPILDQRGAYSLLISGQQFQQALLRGDQPSFGRGLNYMDRISSDWPREGPTVALRTLVAAVNPASPAATIATS